MEVTLEGMILNGLSGQLCSFNPYSNGSYSGRYLAYKVTPKDKWVSILILMEVTLEEQGAVVTIDGKK